MTENLEQIKKQTFRYYYEDGLVEMSTGTLFTVIGLNTWLISILPSGTPLSIAAWILLPLLTIGGIIGVQRVMKRLKERLVYPRTGYIDYSTKPNPYRWFVIGGALLVAIAALVLPYQWLTRQSAGGGIIMFIVLASIGAQVGLRRLIAIGGLSLVSGISLAFLPGSEHAGFSLMFAITGVGLLITGGLALREYLGRNPQSLEEV